MTKDEFNGYFKHLQMAFGQKTTEGQAEVYFKRFQFFEADVFEASVNSIIDNDDKFPRISRMLSVILEVKHQMLVDKVNRDREKSFLESTASILNRIPFPKDLKNALDQKIAGKITQGDLEEVCRIWISENIENECPRKCSDGYVVYEKLNPTDGKKKSMTARCDCDLGELRLKRLPKITEIFSEVPF